MTDDLDRLTDLFSAQHPSRAPIVHEQQLHSNDNTRAIVVEYRTDGTVTWRTDDRLEENP